MPCWPSTASRPSIGITCAPQTRSRACSPRFGTGRSAPRARSPGYRQADGLQADHGRIQNLAETEGRKPVAQGHPGVKFRDGIEVSADITQRRLNTSSPKFRHSSHAALSFNDQTEIPDLALP